MTCEKYGRQNKILHILCLWHHDDDLSWVCQSHEKKFKNGIMSLMWL
jgi:hypothetical protein